MPKLKKPINTEDDSQIYFSIPDEGERGINTVKNLGDYIDMLFRVDALHQHVNDKTPDNFVLFPLIDEKTAYIFDDEQNRLQLRDTLQSMIATIMTQDSGHDDLRDNDIRGRLFSFRLNWSDDDSGEQTTRDLSIEERDYIVQHFKADPNTHLLCLICLRDKKVQELRGLFIWEPGEPQRLIEALFYDIENKEKRG